MPTPADTYEACALRYATRELRAQPGTTVIPGHDPRLTAEFDMAAPDYLDLTVPARKP